MKKSSLFITTLMLLISFTACKQPDSPNTPSKEEDNSAQILAEKKALYKILVGTSWKGYNRKNEEFTVVFAEDSITIDGIKYSLNQDTDLYYQDELPSDVSITECNPKKPLCIKLSNGYYALSKYLLSSNKNSKELGFASEIDSEYEFTILDLVSSSSGSGSTEESSSVNGTYKFETTTGSQVNGSITLTDGEWSYRGSKTNVAASSGTYTVAGSKITVKWTAAGTDLEENFTVSTTESSSTWTSENTYTSTFLSMLFGVTQTELTFEYTE